MANYKLTLSYEGTRYRGWQRQGNTENTIQEKLETLLSRIIGEEAEISGCGRTDGGVHARTQVCSFRTGKSVDIPDVLSMLRQYAPEDIGIKSLETAPERFHARLSCREKSYLYRINNSPVPDVFERRFQYQYPGELDLEAMRLAAGELVGEHDFAAFCSLKRSKKSTVRALRSIEITRQGDEIRILLTGDGFLYNMVRIIVGTLIEAGEHKLRPEDMMRILASCDRRNAGFTAPAQGLTLWDITY